MSEARTGPVQAQSEPLADLLMEIEEQTSSPPGGDPIIANMWEGLLTELPQEPGLQGVFETFGDFRMSGTVSERAGLLRTIIMADVLRDEVPGAAAIPQTYEQWCQYFRDLGSDYRTHDKSNDPVVGARIDDLSGNILNLSRSVQTNIDRRYVSTELLMQSDPKYRDGAVWLDIGCGVQQGQHALALKCEQPLAPVHIVDEAASDRPDLETKVSELLARPSLIKAGVGVDLFDPRERKSKVWVRASLRPTSELLDPAFMERYDLLADAEVPHVQARQLDITDDEAVGDFMDEMPDFRPNLVTLHTVAHQLNADERDKCRRNIRRLAAHSATLVLQDFAYAVSPRPNYLRYYNNWHVPPYRYSMFRRDLGGQRDYWQKQLSFDESHGRTLKLYPPMADLVASA